MVDYYKTLGIQQSASASEIKSAYRRLARTHHPDHNAGSEQAAREFALISLAYRTLSDPHERAFYDHQRSRVQSGFASSSVLDSNNVHARRMRRVATQARLNRVVDSWIEEGRRETFALQQAVFPTVTLFLSTFFAVMLKPRFWEGSTYFGRAVLFTLFLIGLWHLVSRWRVSLERYTYRPKKIQDSLMQEEEPSDKPFTRFTAYSFLVAAFFASIAAGYFLGEQIHYVILSDMPFFFDQHMRPDHLFYPPIAVLIVDSMHALAAKIDLSL